MIDCTLVFPHPPWYWENLLKICVFIFAFIMPVLIITVCYGLMILRLKSVRMLSGSKVGAPRAGRKLPTFSVPSSQTQHLKLFQNGEGSRHTVNTFRCVYNAYT